MVVVTIHEKEKVALTMRGKLGTPWGLPYWLGWTQVGGPVLFSGDFQVRHRKRGRMITLDRHHWPKRITTVAAMANKNKFKNGVLAWHALTLGQKKFYNDKTYPVAATGFTRFMSEYMRT